MLIVLVFERHVIMVNCMHVTLNVRNFEEKVFYDEIWQRISKLDYRV